MVSKTCSTFISILSLSWLLSGCAQEVVSESISEPMQSQASEQGQYELASFCSTKGYNLSQNVTISDVTGIANHRDGYLMIRQGLEQVELKTALLKLAKNQDVSISCMEYLSSNGLVEFGSGEGLLARIYFDFDSKSLTPESRLILDKVAKRLVQAPEVIKLVGHTDNSGSEEYNYSLGLLRADNTQAYLNKQGVRDTQLKSESQGETRPIASNETVDGRELNRRVELLQITPH
ncbi:OmpA family protein [Shewanella nanhaiensis]|uniref:OmpA family protein n=1 Tax=Shewanella nanhaiensis TaxID=2864872 RepID=A0ABS7E2M1_9GAMM|nr:OmpA family protein [Shewanella nanhaiensis]MBW8183267.1 OmpA family protein [Shewanella nanhaiensis]